MWLRCSGLFVAGLCVLSALPSRAQAATLTPLLDGAGSLKTVPGEVGSITTVVTSPGTPSSVLNLDADAVDQVVFNRLDDDSILVCRGATLGTLMTEELSSISLSICSQVSSTIIVDGIVAGDLVRFRDSRHARTLSAIFRARDPSAKQTLILAIGGEFDQATIQAEVEFLYEALYPKKQLSDAYDLKLVKVNLSSGSEVR